MTETQLADLVRRARDSRASIRDQHAAFAKLVERFEEMAFVTALVACEDTETARDACQEAFLVAWRTLPALREPAAFGGWLKRLVRTHCVRARRRGASAESRARDFHQDSDGACDTAEIVSGREVQALVRSAVVGLPPSEREAVLLFYFLGESLQGVARALGVTAGRAGRLVYDARLRLRSSLPRGVTETFLPGPPTSSFARRVRAGMLDELVGEYRFDERPGRPVVVRRVADVLVCEAGGQRNVLTSSRPDTFAPVEYDGEARFRRDRRGRIRDFVYYEFGRRLGVARKLQGTKPPTTASRPPGGSPRTSRSASPTSRPRRTRSGAPPGRTHRGHPHSPPAPR
jgi:RNA polymerase sigma-70 factor (ECF subfamily)